jgi:hypothetical protein
LPTEPVFPGITPDPIQVERWNEYEDALAKAVYSLAYQPEDVVCEWVILGKTGREVYVWAYCASTYSAGPSQASVPAVIYLGTDRLVQNAEIPGSGTAYGPSIQRMFPPEIQSRIFDHSISLLGAGDRIRWRRGHPNDPPLIVLPFLPAQPTQPAIPWDTAEPVQAEKWMEYQTALARVLAYLDQDRALCEWEFLGRAGNEVYVWAICGAILDNRVGREGLVRIDVFDNGSVQSAMELVGGIDIRNMLPLDAQQKYFHGLIHFQELVDLLRWRQSHPDEPPLIVLPVTPTP